MTKLCGALRQKGIRVRTKPHSLPAYSHPIHMLILQVTAGRGTYSMKDFTVEFIQTSLSKKFIRMALLNEIVQISKKVVLYVKLQFPCQPGMDQRLSHWQEKRANIRLKCFCN